MKIVGFEGNGGLHLGVVDGDAVIDLQAGDGTMPGDLGEVLRRSSGDLSPLREASKRAPPGARRPLKGLKFGLPVARPGKVICLGLNYLEHVKEGSQTRQHSEIPDYLHARQHVAGAAWGADHPPERVRDARL